MKNFTFRDGVNVMFMLGQILFFVYVMELVYQDGSHEFSVGGNVVLQFICGFLLQYLVTLLYGILLVSLLYFGLWSIRMSGWQHIFLFVCTILMYFLKGEVIAVFGIGSLFMIQYKKYANKKISKGAKADLLPVGANKLQEG